MHSELPDSELIRKAKEGHKTSFEHLFRRYNRQILVYAYRYTGNYQRAEDLTQETFLKVFRYIDSYKEEGKFSSWLYTIAGNLIKNEIRSRRKSWLVSMDAPTDDGEGEISLGDKIAGAGPAPSARMQETEAQKELAGLLKELSPKYREVLILCDIQEMSYEEAAKILKCGTGTVGSRLNRARRMLMELTRKGRGKQDAKINEVQPDKQKSLPLS